MLAMLNQLGRSLAKMRDSGGNCWPELNKLFEVETIPGEFRYELPDDYYTIIKKTAWAADQYHRLDDPQSPSDWAFHQNALADVSLYPRFRLAADNQGKYIELDPVPGGSETIQFQYISKNWVKNGGNMFISDAEEPVFDEYLMELGLIAKYTQRRGLPFAYELAQFEEERDRQLGSASGSRDINLTKNPLQETWQLGETVGMADGTIRTTLG